MKPAAGTAPLARWSGWLSAVVVLAVAAAQVRFVIRDIRLPRDHGLYFQSLPTLYADLGGDAPLQAAWDALHQRGGWYNLLLGLASRLFEPSPYVFHAFDLFWVLLALGLITAIARRLGGPVAGLIAVAIAGGFQMIVVSARHAWIHIPELSLILCVLWAWTRDREIRARQTVWIMGITGALAMMLRPSGMTWVATFLPIVAWRLRSAESRWRAASVLTMWMITVAFAAQGIVPYLSAKVNTRPRYVANLPDLWEQLGRNLGLAAGSIAAIGAIMCIMRYRHTAVRLLGSWLALAGVMFLVFRVGINNFPAFGAALAILAGWGLSRWPRIGLTAAMSGFLLHYIPQWVPVKGTGPTWHQAMSILHIPFEPIAERYYRPYTGAGAPDVLALIHEACPDTESTCEILVDQGLFHPTGEDPSAQLERFLSGLDHVRVVELRWSWPELIQLAEQRGHKPDKRRGGRWDSSRWWPNLTQDSPAALATFRCAEREAAWRKRYPNSLEHIQSAVQTYDLRPTHEVSWNRQCALIWMTPGGR